MRASSVGQVVRTGGKNLLYRYINQGRLEGDRITPSPRRVTRWILTRLRIAVEGISHKMLTQNLRMLERNGLVERCVHPTVPPRVEYTLTESGQALRVIIGRMCEWTQRYLGEIEASRRRFGA
ncbi:winged helix-turn-helix transcriptional regulator [Nocardia sp. NPDC004260]